MKKGIILASVTTLTILMTPLVTGCKSSVSPNIPPDQFTTASSSTEERISNIQRNFDQYLEEVEIKIQN